MRSQAILLVLFLLFTSSLSYSYQDKKKGSSDSDQDPIRLNTTLVQVPVIVSEPGGRYVLDLTREDFSIFEDGVRQEIEFFGGLEEPFLVALLIDSSGSTISQLEKIKESAIAFISKLKPNDQVMIISFNDSVQVHSELTGDRNQALRALRSIRPGEFTQVYEAIYTAVWERLNNHQGRKAVIVFTDGIDTASSEITLEDTLDAIIESEDILVYPIRYDTRPEVEKRLERKLSDHSGNKSSQSLSSEREILNLLYADADAYLDKLAAISGGLVTRANQLKDLDAAFQKIADELRQQYVLGYYPPTGSSQKGERKIKVMVNRGGLKVRSRPGYFNSK
jgi:Ca-activated chloride channel homolog